MIKIGNKKLCHITFTGVDANTDIKQLREIQEEFPIAEFGVLTSYHWQENGNRYLDPTSVSLLRKGHLSDRRLNLSLHICGSATKDAALGNWDNIYQHMRGNLEIFDRIQLNIAGRKDNFEHISLPAFPHQEVIIQQKDVNNMSTYKNTISFYPYPVDKMSFSVLLDASGGRGVDTLIQIYGDPHVKVGYAGGLNPDNVGEKLSYLLESDDVHDFWIDMESGVRTDDWLDLNKVVQVLDICRYVIKEHK